MRGTKTATFLVIMLGLGCDGSPVGVDAAVEPDAATDAGTDAETPPGGDGNDTFADADPITVGGDPTMGAIATPGDRDYYRFEGTAGAWVVLWTEANPDDDPARLDTVITLYDASMTRIAENDDGVPRASTDSEIITRLPASGTYYVLVQEYAQWAGETPRGMASFTYALRAVALDPAAAAVTADPETGDDLASATPLGFATATSGTVDYGFLLGDVRDASDVDVFSFSVPAGRRSARFAMMPSGATGYGSTTSLARMWITTADGADVIARVTIAEGGMEPITGTSPPLPPGDYRLFVEGGAAPGANGFYVLKAWRFASDNDPEDAATDADNDLPAGAQALTLAPVEGTPTTRRAFVLAQLGDADVDHFSFEVMGTERVSVFCGSATAGSGVRGLSASVLDATGASELSSATETATAAIAIRDLAVSAPGTYLLRLRKASQDPTVSGTWVRCGVTVAPPG